MVSFFSLTPSTPLFLSSSPLVTRHLLNPHPSIQFKHVSGELGMLQSVNCTSNEDSESEAHNLTSGGISMYNWCAGIGALGFIETAYLSYLKLTNSDAFCPLGGGTCGDILNSDYAVVFGIPLPLIGMVAYGLVATFGFQLARKSLPFGITEDNARMTLLGSVTSMAAASAYFVYILNTSFTVNSCSYCLISALLSFTLLFTTMKEFELQKIKNVLGVQLCIAGLVVTALGTSYGTIQPVSSSMAEIEMKPFTTEITTPSSPFAVSLAKHLHSLGAKMYGAFWCSHCVEQKQMFGFEASKILDYVECFPDGYRKGTKIAKACSEAAIEGFPTWVINGQPLSGEQELTELAQVSGFNEDVVN